MEKEKIIQELQMYNNLIHQNKILYRAELWGNIISSILFSLFVSLNLLIIVTSFGGRIISDETSSIIRMIAGILPFVDSNMEFWHILLCIAYMFVIPIIGGYIAIFIVRIAYSKKEVVPIDDTKESFIRIEESFTKRNDQPYIFNAPIVYAISIPASILSLIVFCIQEALLYSNQSVITDAGMRMIFLIFLSVIIAVVPFIISLSFFAFIQLITILANDKRLKKYKILEDNFKKFHTDIETEKAERIRREKEEREEQEKLRIAFEAEKHFRALDAPESNENILIELADKKSPSACLYLGKKLWHQFFTEALTNSEKEQLASKCKEYLEIARENQNEEAEFLLLSIRASTESNNCAIWKKYLSQAREFKKSQELSQNYAKEIDSLINRLIEVIDRIEKSENINHSSQPSSGCIGHQSTGHSPASEDSYIHDWRTGERLKRNSSGEIVNSKGEKVSSAWWV